jgi:hypothetical protein
LTGATAFAGTLLDDADAAAARTTLGLATVASSGSYADLSNTPTATSGLATSEWQAGTSTTEAIVSPAKVKASIISNTVTYVQPTTVGAVGTYAWLRPNATGIYDYIVGGTDYAGSTLTFSAIQTSVGNAAITMINASPSGTWRAIGSAYNGFTGTTYRSGLYLRIS